MKATLTINSRTYTESDLLAKSAQQSLLSDNARAALDFCCRWLGGQAEFTLHTSGSTSAPKPITLRRVQMESSAWATARALDLRAGMSALVCMPVRYIAGQMMLARGLALGLAMTLVEPASDPLAGLPPDATFDFTAVVPLQLQTLLGGPAGYRERLNRMAAILVGGAPVSAALEQQTQALAAPVYHTYGMTETATHVALRRLNGPDASPWFHPLPGVEVATDDRGCLRLTGPMTLGRWLQTNDLVDLAILPGQPSQAPAGSDDGSRSTVHTASFRWLGRWDNVINSGGVKVQVEAVEAAVGQAWQALGLAERRFFVAGLPDPRLGERVTLWVEGDPLPAEQQAALAAAMAQALHAYEVPRQVFYAPRFAETATGKIDRWASLPGASLL
jgi:O-succinylbenzoic acid--CoA ligase